MTNNDILRRLRYALDIKDPTMIAIFKLSEYEIAHSNLIDLLKKEEEEGYVDCSDEVLGLFLDGLIIHKRGKSGMLPVHEEKQIQFILTLKTFILQHGAVDKKDLIQAPFTQLHPEGIRGIFPPGEIEEILGFVEKIGA